MNFSKFAVVLFASALGSLATTAIAADNYEVGATLGFTGSNIQTDLDVYGYVDRSDKTYNSSNAAKVSDKFINLKPLRFSQGGLVLNLDAHAFVYTFNNDVKVGVGAEGTVEVNRYTFSPNYHCDSVVNGPFKADGSTSNDNGNDPSVVGRGNDGYACVHTYNTHFRLENNKGDSTVTTYTGFNYSAGLSFLVKGPQLDSVTPYARAAVGYKIVQLKDNEDKTLNGVYGKAVLGAHFTNGFRIEVNGGYARLHTGPNATHPANNIVWTKDVTASNWFGGIALGYSW